MASPLQKLFALPGLLVLGGLSACITPASQECQVSNWEIIGLGEGRRGSKPVRLEQYLSQCSNSVTASDTAAYKKGRDRGLLLYCTPETGYQEAIQGNAYQGVCPENVEASFFDAYRFGNKLYTLKTNVMVLQEKLSQAQEYQRRLESDAQHNQFVISQQRNSPDVREKLLAQLQFLELELSETKHRIQTIRLDIDLRTDEFKQMQRFNPYRK